MIYMVVNEKGKIRKFETLEKTNDYMKKHEGIYFMIEISEKAVGVSVIESKNGEISYIKGTLVSRYPNL